MSTTRRFCIYFTGGRHSHEYYTQPDRDIKRESVGGVGNEYMLCMYVTLTSSSPVIVSLGATSLLSA